MNIVVTPVTVGVATVMIGAVVLSIRALVRLVRNS